jgi:hypothetical protein
MIRKMQSIYGENRSIKSFPASAEVTGNAPCFYSSPGRGNEKEQSIYFFSIQDLIYSNKLIKSMALINLIKLWS